MELVEAGRETEIGELYVPSPIKQNIVWLDITVSSLAVIRKHDLNLNPYRWMKPSL
jgi:hypothetical protein